MTYFTRTASLTLALGLSALTAGAVQAQERAAELPPLGAKWKEVLPKKKVYANADSIEKIGEDTYRAVIVSETFRDQRTIDTDEIRCAENSARTIRVREAGKVAMTSSRDLRFAKDPFVKTRPGSEAAAKYRKVCELARDKFKK
jgi:hypothetical protein